MMVHLTRRSNSSTQNKSLTLDSLVKQKYFCTFVSLNHYSQICTWSTLKRVTEKIGLSGRHPLRTTNDCEFVESAEFYFIGWHC